MLMLNAETRDKLWDRVAAAIESYATNVATLPITNSASAQDIHRCFSQAAIAPILCQAKTNAKAGAQIFSFFTRVHCRDTVILRTSLLRVFQMTP
jgi:hypothetical protein